MQWKQSERKCMGKRRDGYVLEEKMVFWCFSWENVKRIKKMERCWRLKKSEKWKEKKGAMEILSSDGSYGSSHTKLEIRKHDTAERRTNWEKIEYSKIHWVKMIDTMSV